MRSRQSLWRLLKALAEPGPETARSVDCLAGALQRATSGLPTGSLVFVIADLNREPMSLEQVLGNLIQRHTVVLLPVDDPSDWEIPDMGHVTFTGTDGELIEIDTGNEPARKAYLEGWEERRNALNPTPTNSATSGAWTLSPGGHRHPAGGCWLSPQS